MIYNEEELTTRITTFLARKEAKFPELGAKSLKEVWKDSYKSSPRGSDSFALGW